MKKIEQIVKKNAKPFKGHVGVGFKDLRSGMEYYYNGEEKVLAASVFKVPVLVELYNQAMSGILELNNKYEMCQDDVTWGSGVLKELKTGVSLTLKDYAVLMMIVSDNVATDIILKIIGKEKVNKTMQYLKLKDTKVMMSCSELLSDALNIKSTDSSETIARKVELMQFNRKAKCFTDYENNNVTSPIDMVKLFEIIYNKHFPNGQSCEDMLDIMRRCQLNWRIPRYLPKKVKVAHKTGSIAGIVNDVGIIFTNKGDYILAVFTNGPESDCQINVKGYDFIASISKEIFDFYEST